jgi:hypothetical protein
VLARTHSAGGSVENVRQRVAVASTSPVASVPRDEARADESCVHRRLDRPRVIAVGKTGQEVQKQPIGHGKDEQDPDSHAREGPHAAIAAGHGRALVDRHGIAVEDRNVACASRRERCTTAPR